MREVRSRQWRCGITIHDQYRQWEMVQVFRVEFGTEEGPDPAVEPNNCTLCGGQWLPLRTACPYHQFAISETQLHELWQRWDPRMDPINPIEQEYCEKRELFGPSQMIFPSDGWLISGSSAYLISLTRLHNASALALVVCVVCTPIPPVLVMIW